MTGRQLVLLSARLFKLVADVKLVISGASDSVPVLLLCAHESLFLAQCSLGSRELLALADLMGPTF